MSFTLAHTDNGWTIAAAADRIVASFRRSGRVCAALDGDGAAEWPFTCVDIGAAGPDLIEGFFAADPGGPPVVLRETIRRRGENVLSIARRWENRGDSTVEFVPVMEAVTGYEPSFWLIPCVNYDGNDWGTGQEPKGMTRDGRPWVYAYRRIGIPSATFSENEAWCVGLFADPDDAVSMTSSASLLPRDRGVIHRILWPEREEPLAYTHKDGYSEPLRGVIRLAPGAAFDVVCHLTVSPVARPRTGWWRTYDLVHDLFPRRVEAPYAPEQVWDMAIAYAAGVQYSEVDGLSLFDMGLLPDGSHALAASPERRWERRMSDRFEIGWCGQNAALAHAMLHDYARTGNRRSLEIGLRVLDTWAARARGGNGLFRVMMDGKPNGEEEFVSDTCNLGWGAWQFLLAWQQARRLGIDRPAWRAFGLDLCDFFVAHGNADGRLGKTWTSDGACLDWEGTIGCFLLLPLLQAYRMTADGTYLETAARSFRYYAQNDLYRMRCTAGALDTCCIDKETCWPLLRAALDLYEITADASYLRDAEFAGYYLLSWMFLYDARYSPESDFARHGYRTYGGTAVSTQHHQLDPWGALISADWFRLARHTGDGRWAEWARATWANSLYGLSDGTLVVRGMVRPRGAQNEGFRQCNWGTWERSGEQVGRFDDWLVSWPGAFRLVALMHEEWAGCLAAPSPQASCGDGDEPADA